MDERIYWLRVDQKSIRVKKNVRFSRISGFVWTEPEATQWGQLLNLFALTVACVAGARN